MAHRYLKVIVRGKDAAGNIKAEREHFYDVNSYVSDAIGDASAQFFARYGFINLFTIETITSVVDV